jgi:hypothetical protein
MSNDGAVCSAPRLVIFSLRLDAAASFGFRGISRGLVTTGEDTEDHGKNGYQARDLSA